MAEITARAITPVAVEMLDGVMLRMVEEATHAGYPMDAARRAADRTRRPARGRGRAGGADARSLPSAARANSAWRAPPKSATCCGRAARTPSARWAASAPTYYVQDGVVPRTKIAPTLRFIGEVARQVRPHHQQHLPCRRRQHAPHHSVRPAQARRPRKGARGGRGDPDATASTPAARSPASTASAWRRTS